jgi:hypothetical protein
MTVLISTAWKSESWDRLGCLPMKLLALLSVGINPDAVVGQLRVSFFTSLI